jgi:hypothetical protein
MVLTIEEAQSEVAWAELVTERVEFEVESKRKLMRTATGRTRSAIYGQQIK